MPDIQDLELFPQAQYVPLSTNIVDYAQSLTMETASGGVERTVSQSTSGSDHSLGASFTFKIASEHFTATAAELRSTMTECSFWIKKVGAPTGTATIGIFDGTATLLHTFGTIDVSTLTTGYVKYTFNTGYHIIASGNRVGVQFTGGDGTNYIAVDNTLTDQYDSTNTVRSSWTGSSWNNNNSAELKFEFKFANPGTEMIDNNTGTFLTLPSETNPFVTVDMGSALEIAAIALYRGASDTTTSIMIEVSPDDVTYTLVRTIDISLITTGQYSYIVINRQITAMRYIKITGLDATAQVISYAEIKVRVLTKDDFSMLHKHKTISVNDSSLALHGDTE